MCPIPRPPISQSALADRYHHWSPALRDGLLRLGPSRLSIFLILCFGADVARALGREVVEESTLVSLRNFRGTANAADSWPTGTDVRGPVWSAGVGGKKGPARITLTTQGPLAYARAKADLIRLRLVMLLSPQLMHVEAIWRCDLRR